MKNISDAKANSDWVLLYQYRFVSSMSCFCLFYYLFPSDRFILVILLYQFVHYCYLKYADLSELDSIIHCDSYRWVVIDKNAYLVAIAYLLLAGYFFYISYFSSKSEYFIKTRHFIYFQPEKIKYHWPYRYKQHKQCGHLLRDYHFYILNSFCRIFIVTIGKKKVFFFC